MSLYDGLSTEVKQRLVEKSKGIIETEQPCSFHPRYKMMLMPDGKLICPVCEKEKRDEIVAKEKTQEYYENSVEGKRDYLYSDSIVSNQALLKKGLKDFITNTPEETAIRKKANNLIYDIAGGDPLNLYLEGVPGCGKSHLAMGILKNANAVAKGKRCLFVNFPALQQKIRKSIEDPLDDNSEPKLTTKMRNADILVLDDIGNEINPFTMKGKVSEFAARILYNVMDAREGTKPTILTSNIPFDDLKKIMDPRLTSRMSSRLRLFSFGGIKDKRGRK